jgi:hypothetical protein
VTFDATALTAPAVYTIILVADETKNEKPILINDPQGVIAICSTADVVVPQARLERALLSEQDFESSASTIPPLGHNFYGPTRQSGGSSNRASVPMQAHPYVFSAPISSALLPAS